MIDGGFLLKDLTASAKTLNICAYSVLREAALFSML